MDTDNSRLFDKPTFIYGLVDPRTNQLRYVGKTILAPERRLGTHLWAARRDGPKRHAHAWLRSVLDDGAEPEIVLLETVAPLGDWVEAEEFWISYFRFVGANLCNLTTGGDGSPGLKINTEQRERRLLTVKRGENHHRYGKPMPPQVQAALNAAGEKLRSDPFRNTAAIAARRAGMTPEKMAPSIAGLRAMEADPDRLASREENRLAAIKSEEFRVKIGDWSRQNWAENRNQIIAAQNEGKGAEWSRKQSELGRIRLADKDHPLRVAALASRRVSDEDVIAIRELVASGVKNKDIAQRFDISPSLVSHIKSGRKR